MSQSTTIQQMQLGHKMIVELGVPTQAYVIESGQYEPTTMDLCLRLLPPGGIALDIGANIGFYACAFAQQLNGSNGKVYAFEPIQRNYLRLCENIELNKFGDLIQPLHLGLGRVEGILDFHIQPEGETNNAVGDNVASDGDRFVMKSSGWKEERARITRLDTWSENVNLNRFDLIKIDVEGGEMFVFEGA